MENKTSNNTVSNDELIQNILSEANETETESTETTADETTEQSEETNTAVEEAAESEESQTDEVVESEPTSNKEVNKTEAIKALKKKNKELALKVQTFEEGNKESEGESTSDLIKKLSQKTGKDVSEISKLFQVNNSESGTDEVETEAEPSKVDELVKQVEELSSEFTKGKKTQQIADAIDTFIEQTQIDSEDGIKDFFKKAKEDFGMDFVKNPNPKAMIALYRGSLSPEKIKEQTEQEVLLDIKNGANAKPETKATDSQALAAKKEKEQWDAREKAWMAKASK